MIDQLGLLDGDEIIRIVVSSVKKSAAYFLDHEPLAKTTLVIGILTLAYSVASYNLQKKSFSWTREMRDRQAQEEKRIRLDLENAAQRRVPDPITLSDRILFVPTLVEVGIPTEIGYLGIFKPLVKEGEWITRGDDLLTMNYWIFENHTKPRWSFLSDPVRETTSVTLKSPASGLIIGFRLERSPYPRTFSPERYDARTVFPIILLPKGEEEPDDWELSFYENMISTLERNWWFVAYSGHYGKSRLREEFPDLKAETYDNRPLRDYRYRNAIDKFEVRPIRKDDDDIWNSIRKLRKSNTYLQIKLGQFAKSD